MQFSLGKAALQPDWHSFLLSTHSCLLARPLARNAISSPPSAAVSIILINGTWFIISFLNTK